jgi:hypothetical protein
MQARDSVTWVDGEGWLYERDRLLTDAGYPLGFGLGRYDDCLVCTVLHAFED